MALMTVNDDETDGGYAFHRSLVGLQERGRGRGWTAGPRQESTVVPASSVQPSRFV